MAFYDDRGPVLIRAPWLLLMGMIILMLGTPAAAQRIDPDWNLLASDSRDHFLAGGGISAAARLIFPKAHGWQRLAIVATVALSYELGQEGVARNSGLHGPGFGLSPKDVLCTVAGGLLVELLWPGKP